jgi:hypothetical protein
LSETQKNNFLLRGAFIITRLEKDAADHGCQLQWLPLATIYVSVFVEIISSNVGLKRPSNVHFVWCDKELWTRTASFFAIYRQNNLMADISNTFRGRLHGAFWMAAFMYDKPFVAKACNIGVRQKTPPNLHIWQAG